MTAGYRLGIDIGGTFTDAVLLSEETGNIRIVKVSSTPDDLARGFLSSVDQAVVQNGLAAAAVQHFVHGTTVATNAIIEGKTARTALVVTRGFRDLLEIARQTRPDLYDLFADKPEPLVPRNLCFEVRERLDANGSVLIPLAEDELDGVAEAIRAAGVTSVAVCFLHSYRYPDHERRATARLAERCPGVLVSASCEVWPEFREYLRASTTVVNAAIRPVVSRYLDHIATGLAQRGIQRKVHIMQSNGGICSAEVARELPVYIVESGPAAGVMAAVQLGTAAGFSDLISFDMGGTTAKVSLIQGGRPKLSTEFEVGARAAAGRGASRGRGYPIRTPVLDLVEVGAGGGSIAWVDSGGIMHVGPQSAGADPGPACYGRGGREPTVTDANLVLGRLDPENFLGGEMQLDVDAAWRAIETRCARPTGLDLVAAAHGIVELANANMVGAIRLVSVQRGYDPREFALLAFGGAGPLHANALAAELAIPTTIVPPIAGVASALGLLLADLMHDRVVTRVQRLASLDLDGLNRIYADFEAEGTAALVREGVDPREIDLVRTVELRYVGQSYELRIPVPDGELDQPAIRAVEGRFHAEHERSYGYAAQDEPVELVNVRLTALGRVAKPRLQEVASGAADPAGALLGRRKVYFAETGFVGTPIYGRHRLAAQNQIAGPAIVEQMDTTTVIQPRHVGRIDRYGNILISSNGQ
ncbi:MAG: hydantoinase/oxoprolinase family protein [Chloroflexi bacterium]|nr:hydantoinase/oxoprolinase family protein [Chloroflexota bacterium]